MKRLLLVLAVFVGMFCISTINPSKSNASVNAYIGIKFGTLDVGMPTVQTSSYTFPTASLKSVIGLITDNNLPNDSVLNLYCEGKGYHPDFGTLNISAHVDGAKLSDQENLPSGNGIRYSGYGFPVKINDNGVGLEVPGLLFFDGDLLNPGGFFMFQYKSMMFKVNLVGYRIHI